MLNTIITVISTLVLLFPFFIRVQCIQEPGEALQSQGGPTQALKRYTNPIIPGFSPDPSCIRVDEQFYCVTSSFSAFPGIPVYTSRDLVQWEQIGECMHFESLSIYLLLFWGGLGALCY